MPTILVTGGVRSGKSAWAEKQLANFNVTYVTPGYPADPDVDPEWAARVLSHQKRRPDTWMTVETVDVPGAVTAAAGPVLVDCLGTWVSRLCDGLAAWTQPKTVWLADFDKELDRLGAALKHASLAGGTVILVTNEVGWGVIPETPAGRLFADLLGRVNQSVANCCDDVVLMVAGRALPLP